MGFRVRVCHYCGGEAKTKDHIIARCWIPKGTPQFINEANKVPACSDCNGRKGFKRSDCDCPICHFAFSMLRPWLKDEGRNIPIITLQEITQWRQYEVPAATTREGDGDRQR